MDTIGRGNEGWFVGMSLVLMIGVGILLTGGVTEFLEVVDDSVMGLLTNFAEWIRSLV